MPEESHTVKAEVKDTLGNLYTKTQTFTVDLTPVVTASPTTCSFNGFVSVSLTANKPATIYYTIDGSTPTTVSPIYSQSLTFTNTTVLKYFAVDSEGRTSAVESQTYTYDPNVPSITVDPEEGSFYGPVKVTLTPSETCTIYYTLDGSTPTTSSPVYSSTITISTTTTLKYMATDDAGNQTGVYTKTYTIEKLYNPQIEIACQSCHDATAHDSDGVNSNHPNMDCYTCHDTVNPRYRTALAFGLNCSGCHTDGHYVLYYAQFPIQIPKYPGYLWTQPDPYLIYKGDAWTLNNSTVYDNFMLVYTNIRKDVTKEEVLDWYKTKIVQYGWELNNMIYEGTDYFKMPIKSTDPSSSMKATIWMYGDSTNGWALRILYGSS